MFKMLKTASKGIIFKNEGLEPIVNQVLQLPGLGGHALYIQLLSILVQLSECQYQTLSEASFIDDLPTEFGSRMAKIQEYVEGHFNRKIYLNELAELVNMSEQSFSRFFSKMMGRPFFAFLNEYRINMASRMLLDTDWSVAEIGYACGYDSLSFFHRQFNKFMEISPSGYRKKYSLLP